MRNPGRRMRSTTPHRALKVRSVRPPGPLHRYPTPPLRREENRCLPPYGGCGAASTGRPQEQGALGRKIRFITPDQQRLILPGPPSPTRASGGSRKRSPPEKEGDGHAVRLTGGSANAVLWTFVFLPPSGYTARAESPPCGRSPSGGSGWRSRPHHPSTSKGACGEGRREAAG